MVEIQRALVKMRAKGFRSSCSGEGLSRGVGGAEAYKEIVVVKVNDQEGVGDEDQEELSMKGMKVSS